MTLTLDNDNDNKIIIKTMIIILQNADQLNSNIKTAGINLQYVQSIKYFKIVLGTKILKTQ